MAKIGISEADREEIVQGLAHLLADTYTLYLKTQNFHWNITGTHFYDYHLLFEKQYQELAGTVDKIAERIRALGHPAPGSYAQFSKLTCLKEETDVPQASSMLKQLLADHEVIANCARELFPVATKAADEATSDLLIERMDVHEKAAWMLRSSLA